MSNRPGPDDTRSCAVAALDTAIEAHTAARDKVEDVIAVKDFNGQDTSEERACPRTYTRERPA